MQDNGNEQAVLYAAKSTVDKKGSIPTQLAEGRALAGTLGMQVVAEYADEDASAYHANRGPKLAAALDHAEQIGGSLLVQHSDRLARGDGVRARHLVQLVLEAKARGIRLRSKEDDSSLESVLMAAAMGERNTEDSRRKGAAVSKGLARRRKRGQYVGAPPFGYGLRRNAADERVLYAIEAEAAIVRRVFAEYIAGVPQLAITRQLTIDGIKTRQEKRWHQGSIRKVLTNAAYAGLVRDGEKFLEATHPAIIDRETWGQACSLMEASARNHVSGRSPTIHLFRGGMLRCGRCEEAMMPRVEAREGPTDGKYRCYGRFNDSASCDMLPVKRREVDEAVFNYFALVALDVAATRKQVAAATERKVAEARALLLAAEGESQAAAARLARVKRDYTNGDLTAAEWRELRADLEPEATAAEAEVERLHSQTVQAEEGAPLTDAEDEVVKMLADLRESIAGGVRDAEGVEAVRAALLRGFDGFILHRGVPAEAHIELVGVDIWIEPLVSERAIDGYDERLLPVLARAPHEQAANNYAPGRIGS